MPQRRFRGEFKPGPTSVPASRSPSICPRLAQLAKRYAIPAPPLIAITDHATALPGADGPFPIPNTTFWHRTARQPTGLPSSARCQQLRPEQGRVSPTSPSRLAPLRQQTIAGARMRAAWASLRSVHGPLLAAPGRHARHRVSHRYDGSGRASWTTPAVAGSTESAAPRAGSHRSTRNLTTLQRRICCSPRSATRDAFALDKEPESSPSYGPTPFAQNCLLARRLVEAAFPWSPSTRSAIAMGQPTGGISKRWKRQLPLPPTGACLPCWKIWRSPWTAGTRHSLLMGDMGRTRACQQGAGRDHWSVLLIPRHGRRRMSWRSGVRL